MSIIDNHSFSSSLSAYYSFNYSHDSHSSGNGHGPTISLLTSDLDKYLQANWTGSSANQHDAPHDDFWSPPTDQWGKQGFFQYDKTTGRFMLTKVKEKGGNEREPTAEELKQNKDPGTGTIPPRGSRPDYVESAEKGGDGPIWREVAPGQMMQVGYRENGKETFYTDYQQYKAVNDFNASHGIGAAPPPPSTVFEDKDKEHQDFWSPPTDQWGKQGLFHYDKAAGSFVLAEVKENGVERPPTPDELKGSSSPGTGTIPSETLEKDYIESPTPGGNGPIWRKLESGQIMQVGYHQNNQDYYFTSYKTYKAVNDFNASHGIGAAPPPSSSSSSITLTAVSANPPATGSDESGKKDWEFDLPNGKIGVMRWDATAGRSTFVGTKDNKGSPLNLFSGADYQRYNNGPVKKVTPEDPEHKDWPQTLPDTGTIIYWHYDTDLKKDVQIGWQEPGQPPQYVTQDTIPSTRPSSDSTAAANVNAINLYNMDWKQVPTPGNRMLPVPGDKPVSANDPYHPEVRHTAFGDSSGTIYIWDWDRKTERWVAVGYLGNGKALGAKTPYPYNNDDYIAKNSGPDALRISEDGHSDPADTTIYHIQGDPDPNIPDQYYTDLSAGGEVVKRWDHGVWREVGIRNGNDVRYFTLEEYVKRNNLPQKQ